MENYFASTLNLVNHRAKKDHKQQHLSITFAELYEILKSLSVELEIETLPNGEKNINFISYNTAWQNHLNIDLTSFAENFINKFEIEDVPGIEEITSNDTEKGYFANCEAVYNQLNTNKNSISLNYQADLDEIIKNNSSGDNLVLIHSELTDTLNRRLVKQTDNIYNYELSPAGIYRKYYRYEAPGNNVTIFRNNEVLFGGNLSAYQRRVKIYQEVEIPLCAGDILKYKLVKTPYGIGEIINVEENLKKNTYKIKIKY